MSQVFSDEVPELLQSHFEHLQESGLSPDIIRERGYKSELGKAHLQSLGFGRSQCRTPAILVPLWGVDGEVVNYQIRPDIPRINPKGKPIKYETREGASNRFDVPPEMSQRPWQSRSHLVDHRRCQESGCFGGQRALCGQSTWCLVLARQE